MKEHVIEKIEDNSIAAQLGLEPGDVLLTVNGEEIGDVFDYHYFCNEERLTLELRRKDGTLQDLAVEKEYQEDLGITFENGLMDDYRSCHNKCIFCFIDQMPKGMRDTLYFKDDDSRLSFLQGNYVTLTNMKEEDVERIIRYRMEPINISVQTTNPALRCKMLNNRFAGDALEKIKRFYEAGIQMNGQIVLCKGINDGEELERSIRDLAEYLPYMQSVSVVPVGLSKYRDGLYPLEPFHQEDAKEVLSMIHSWQKKCYEEHGLHFIHASDEWYLLAGEPLPEEENYDGYLQLENGVGMLRLLKNEFQEQLEKERRMSLRHAFLKKKKITIATGVSAAPVLRELTEEFTDVFPKRQVRVIAVVNRFFGEQITVAGLLTGQDLKEALLKEDLGDLLLLPRNMLRSGEEVFLDDMTLDQLKEALQVPIGIVESNGQDLVLKLLQ